MSGRKKREPEYPYRYSDFVGSCGIIIPLPRVHRQREKEHQKKLWCPKCERYHNFTEIRYMDPIWTLSGELISELFAPVEIKMTQMPAANIQRQVEEKAVPKEPEPAQEKQLESILKMRKKKKVEKRRPVQIVIHTDRMTRKYGKTEITKLRDGRRVNFVE